MNSISLILILWISTCLTGLITNYLLFLASVEDKNFLHTNNLNGLREKVVAIHIDDAISRMQFKFVYGAAGLWVLFLRTTNDAPLTPTGLITYLVLFLPILWLVINDVRNFSRRRTLIHEMVKDNVVFISVPANTVKEMQEMEKVERKEQRDADALSQPSVDITDKPISAI